MVGARKEHNLSDNVKCSIHRNPRPRYYHLNILDIQNRTLAQQESISPAIYMVKHRVC